MNGMSMMHRSVLRNELDGHRNVKIRNMSVSWKWPVSKVVGDDHRWRTQYQLQ